MASWARPTSAVFMEMCALAMLPSVEPPERSERLTKCCTGTPLDLRTGKTLGDGLDRIAECEQMRLAGGYDHNYALHKGLDMGLAARLSSPLTGRVMDVYTDQPGIQVYSACTTNFTGGKGGAHYGNFCGVCLETQHFPDSPNNPQFPGTTVLRPGEHYDTTTVYAFSVAK